MFNPTVSGTYTSWTHSTTLNAADSFSNHVFGTSIAITDTFIAVGAPGDAQEGENAGAVYLFAPETQGDWTSTVSQVAKIVASDAGDELRFGVSVAAAGTTLVVGSPPLQDGVARDASGAAYFFQPTDASSVRSGIVEMARVSGGAAVVAGAQFGSAVAITDDEQLAVLTAAQNGFNTTAGPFGSAFSVTRSSVSAPAVFTTLGSAINIGYGCALAHGSGGVAAVGFSTSSSIGTGAVYVRSRATTSANNAGVGEWQAVADLNPSSAPTRVDFGQTMAINEEGTLVAGSNGVGSLFVFAAEERNPSGAWTEVLHSGALGGGNGRSISISGTTIVAGMPFNSPLPSVNIFAPQDPDNLGGEWGDPVTLVGGAALLGTADSNFGSAVALSEDLLLVGAPASKGGGSVVEFIRGGDGSWPESPSALFEPSDPEDKAQFGAALSMARRGQVLVVVVGAPSRDDAGTDSGSVYVFRKDTGSAAGLAAPWTEEAKLTPRLLSTATKFGSLVSLDPQTGAIAVSATGTYEATDAVGALHVFVTPWQDAFRENGAEWIESARLISPNDGATGFAQCVAAGDGVAIATDVGGAVFVSTAPLPGVTAIGETETVGDALQRLGCVRGPSYAPAGACPALFLPPSNRSYTLRNDDLYPTGDSYLAVRSHVSLVGSSPTSRADVTAVNVALGSLGWLVANANVSQGLLPDDTTTDNMDGGIFRLAPEGSVTGSLTTATSSAMFVNVRMASSVGRQGGCLYVAGSTATVLDSELVDCAAFVGGGIYAEQGATLVLARTTASSCSATKLNGGALHAAVTAVTMNGCDFRQNTARLSGGGMYAGFASQVSAATTTWSHNVAAGGSGGAVAVAAATAILGGSFEGNTAHLSGGGVFADANSVLTVTPASRFDGNNAVTGGGAIATGGGSVVVTSANLTNGRAEAGGALYCDAGGTVQVDGCEIAHNTAVSQGGGIAVSSCSLLVTSTSLEWNTVLTTENTAMTNGGGGVFVSAPVDDDGVNVVLAGSTICTHNAATRGSAMLLTSDGVDCSVATSCADAPANTAIDLRNGITVAGDVLWLNRAPVIGTLVAAANPSLTVRSMPVALASATAGLLNPLPVAVQTGVPLAAFTIVLRDAYGDVSQALAGDTVELAATYTGSGLPVDVLGSPIASLNTDSHVATFTGLTLLALPGSSVSLSASLKPDRGVPAVVSHVSVALCLAGQRLGSDGRSCVPCNAGTYSSGANADENACVPCLGGVSSVGSTGCVPCANGTAPNAAGQRCEACNATSTSDGTACIPCPIGQHPHPVFRYPCVPCPIGSVRGATSSVCSQCDAGTRADARQSECIDCADGSVSTPGSTKCTPCANGTAPSSTLDSCDRCGSASLFCPLGAVAPVAAAAGWYTTPEDGPADARVGAVRTRGPWRLLCVVAVLVPSPVGSQPCFADLLSMCRSGAH